MMLKYETALDIVNSIIKQIDETYRINEAYLKEVNPIEHIKSRLKPAERIIRHGCQMLYQESREGE